MEKFSRYLLTALLFGLPALNTFSQGINHDAPVQTLCFSGNHQALPIVLPAGITSLFSEDFSGGCPPAGWLVVGNGSTNWQSSATDNAGGTPPEGMFIWTPQFTGNSKLATPAINTAGNDNLFFEFKHMVDDFSGDYTLLVETTSDGNAWNEVWSVYVTDDIEAETVSFIIDNADVGSESFQVAFTYDGDSYNINYWYIDDVFLLEALSLDVGVIALEAPSLAPSGEAIEIAATVKNYGIGTVNFEVSLEIFESAVLVYSSSGVVTGLLPTEEFEVLFNDWAPAPGFYEIVVTAELTGDENPSNNSLNKEIQVVSDVVAKKPLFEEFTSSTCAPCAGANPIIDQVLSNNPGEYSLIKYQMDWPGIGDPYYTEQGGVRRDYYGVSAVPDLYCNADQISPASSLNQTLFNNYASQVTGLDIEVEAAIENESMITINCTISAFADYDAGLRARIAVVERITYANFSTNGEDEFHNVMMALLPDADGIVLGALLAGNQVELTELFDMTQTFMETPNDLAVVVFVQDDANKSVIQSQMVDVTGVFETYSVTFQVEDSEGNPVDDALVSFGINGPMITTSNGQALYPEVFPGTYEYEVSKSGLISATGVVEVEDENISVDVVLELPDYYFFEDFGNGMPSDWTIYTSSGNSNNLYWYSGFVVFWMQNTNDLVIQLMTPEINLTQAGTLFFEAGDVYSTPGILIGTVDHPSEPNTFEEIASFTLTSTMEEYQVVLEGMGLTDSYLAFKYTGPQAGYFYFDNVKISISTVALGAPENLTAFVDDNDVLLEWDIPASEELLGYIVYRDGDSISFSVQTEYTDLDLAFGLYEYHVTALYDAGESGPSNTVTANVGNVLVYCDSEGGGGQYFSQVLFGDIDNASGFEGYGDFTALSTDVEQGTTVPLNIVIASPSIGDDIGVWIDFNQNGEWDEGENLICEMDNGQGVFSWDIEIPGDALLGMTRMRLKDKYWEMGCDPCGYTTWGETEDYSVNIVEYTGITDAGSDYFHVFPNPASGIVYFHSTQELRSLEVFSFAGQRMMNRELTGNKLALETTQLSDGIYLFKVETENSLITRRVMIHH